MNQTSHALLPTRLTQAETSTITSILFVVFGVALLSLAAKVQVPFYPVPMTLQTLALLVIAGSYGLRLGVATVIAYLAAGAAGAPVFAGLVAGPAYLTGPTGGFLAGFVVAAVVIGYASDRGWHESLLKMGVAMVIGLAAVFALGFVWLSTLIGAEKAWAFGVQPFLLADAFKIAIAAASLGLFSRWIKK